AQPHHQLTDRELALVAKQLEDAQAYRVAEAPEVLGDEVGARRRLRNPKRGCKLSQRGLLFHIYLTSYQIRLIYRAKGTEPRARRATRDIRARCRIAIR